MIVTRLKLKNWRNFREIDICLGQMSYILGPNASGKSNLLDAFRFLRDICRPDGGGLQKAVKDRGGIKRLRCLHSRQDPGICIEVTMADSAEGKAQDWRYKLEFKSEGSGHRRIVVISELVWQGTSLILNRPEQSDQDDSLQLTETHLEQTLANRGFRPIVEAFSEITCLHLVPQLLKYGEQIGGSRLENDPFGQGFMELLSKTTEANRDSRLRKIQKALAVAVPQFSELRFKRDSMGHPHLEALYEHHRPKAGWQGEEQFSDGTLRLLGILWSLLDGNGMLLLEEPELSLHQAVVEQIPAMIENVQRSRKSRRQIMISTHSEALLTNPGIDKQGIVILEPGNEGTKIRPVNEEESVGLASGLSVAEVVLRQTGPKNVRQLGLWD